MHLLGEYFDEREWQIDFESPFYIIKKEDVMNASGYAATKNIKETMSSMYLACAKYDRMYRQCIDTFGAALLTDMFNDKHADCNRILEAFSNCYKNHQWFHETKKYMPERFGTWKGNKEWKGFGSSTHVTPQDI